MGKQGEENAEWIPVTLEKNWFYFLLTSNIIMCTSALIWKIVGHYYYGQNEINPVCYTFCLAHLYYSMLNALFNVKCIEKT